MLVMSLLHISPLEIATKQRIQHAIAALEVLCQVLLGAGVHLSALIVSLQSEIYTQERLLCMDNKSPTW